MKKQIFDDYATAVAKTFHLTLDEMFTSSRRGDIVDARQMLYYLCMERPIRISYIQRFLESYDFKVTLVESDDDVNEMVNGILNEFNV